MLRKFYLIAIPFLLFFAHTRAQEVPVHEDSDIALIQSFIRDIAKGEQRPDVILSQHVLIAHTTTDEQYDYLEASIEEISLNLQTKNIDEIDYIPFHELSRKETYDIDPEGKPTDKMYFLYYKERQVLAVYIDKDKIASFTLVSKGDVAHFVTY